MRRAVACIYVLFFLLAGCTQRMICPAYQSAFIYDKDQLRKKFSYFKEDSTPKVYTASKNKYLVAEKTTYAKKVRSLQTVPLKKVFVQVPDSLSGNGADSAKIAADLDRAARSVMDTTMAVPTAPKDTASAQEDSVYVISKDKEVRILKYNMPDSLLKDSVTGKYVPQTPKYYVAEVGFNTEQDNYMWYLRKSLVLPDVRLAQMQKEGEKGKEEGAEGKKGGFFKNLFGRKKKKQEAIDSAELVRPKTDEFDFIDTTRTEQQDVVPEQKQERKGLFGRKRKDEEQVSPDTQPADRRSRKKKKSEQEKPKETPKPEEEDDGF